MSKTKSPFQLQTSECHICIPTSMIMNVKIVSFLKVTSFDPNDASDYQEDMRGHSHISSFFAEAHRSYPGTSINRTTTIPRDISDKLHIGISAFPEAISPLCYALLF